MLLKILSLINLIFKLELSKGKINFGLENQQYNLKTGDLLSLEANVLHDLHAEEESLVRLTIHKIITKDS